MFLWLELSVLRCNESKQKYNIDIFIFCYYHCILTVAVTFPPTAPLPFPPSHLDTVYHTPVLGHFNC